MPDYCYLCEANRKVVVVNHDINTRLKTWGEVCYVNRIPMDDTDPMAPVRKLVTAPNVITRTGNSELRSLGFTKLVKRDDGVYENVTASANESRYMCAGDPSSVPDFSGKVGD